jgi:pimeloyl-ACP methyl ester carboxylesterase
MNDTSRIQLGTHTLRARNSGEGSTNIFCLHGLADSLEIWDGIAPHLEPYGRVCRIDQRGHGESTAPGGPYSRNDLADDVVAVLDAEGTDTALLIGHSMGGVVAMTTALRYPQRVRGLILIGSTSQCAAKVSDWYERIARAAESDGLEGLRRAIYGGKSKKIIRGDGQGIAHMTRMLKSLHDDPLTPMLAEITCPVLVLVGEQDPMGPKASRIIYEALPRGRADFISIPDRGHWLQVEAGGEFLDALDAWLGKCLP